MIWYKITFSNGGQISIEAENWAEAVKLALNLSLVKRCKVDYTK